MLAPAGRANREAVIQGLALGSVLLLGTALRLVALGRPSLWADEIQVALAAQGSIGQVLEGARSHVSAPPLDYLVVHLLLTYVGKSEFILRSGAAFWSILSLPLIYQLGKRVAGPWAGIVAALLLATSPFHLDLSREAKFYAALVAFSLLCNVTFLHALHSGRTRHWLAHALSSVVGIYFHPFVALTVLCQGVYLVLGWVVERVRQRGSIGGPSPLSQRARDPARCGLAPFFLSAIASALCFLPWFLWDMAQQAPLGEYHTALSPSLISDLLRTFSPSRSGLNILLAVLAVLGVVTTGTSRRRMQGGGLLVLNVLAIGLVILLDNAGSYWFAPKQTLFALPAFLTLAAAGLVSAGRGHWIPTLGHGRRIPNSRWAKLSDLARRVVGPVLVVACLAPLAWAGAGDATQLWLQERQNWRGAAALVQAYRQAGEPVLAWRWDQPSFGYYAPDSKPLYRISSLAELEKLAKAPCIWYVRTVNIREGASRTEYQRVEDRVRQTLDLTIDVGQVQISYGCPGPKGAAQAERTALTVLKEAARLYPRADTLFQLGRHELEQGQAQNAVGHLQQALAQQPNSARILTGLGQAYQALGRLAEAEEVYRRSIEVEPGYVGAYLHLGTIREGQGQGHQALELYQKAAEIAPNLAWAQVMLGGFYLAGGAPASAVIYLEKAVELDASSGQAHTKLGNAYRALGHVVKAETAYRRSIEVEPGYLGAYINLGSLLLSQGHDAKALELYRRAVQVAPDSAWALSTLGSAYLGQGDAEQALEYLERAVELEPRSVVWLLDLAEGYRQLGMTEDEIRAYEKVLTLEPGHRGATQALQEIRP